MSNVRITETFNDKKKNPGQKNSGGKRRKSKPKRRRSRSSTRSVSSVVSILKGKGRRRSSSLVRIKNVTPVSMRSVNATVKRAEVGASEQNYEYIAGFADPENSNRGPGSASAPTVVIKFRSITSYAPVVSGLPYTNDTGVNAGVSFGLDNNGAMHNPPYVNANFDVSSTFAPGQIQVQSVGDPILFVSMPHYLRTFNEGTIPFSAQGVDFSRAAAGFATPMKGIKYGQAMYTNTWPTGLSPFPGTNGVTTNNQNNSNFMTPMSPLTTEIPIEPFNSGSRVVTTSSGNTVIPDIAMTRMVPHRIVGNAIQVRPTNNIFFTGGVAYGGNFSEFYDAQMTNILNWDVENNTGTSASASGRTAPSSTILNSASPGGEETLLGPVTASNRRKIGEIQKGHVSRAWYKPTSDRITQWSDATAIKSACTFYGNLASNRVAEDNSVTRPVSFERPFVQTIGQMLSNNPAAYIYVTNWVDGSTFDVETTVAIEFVVRPDSIVSLMLDMALFNDDFKASWMLLQTLPIAFDMCDGNNQNCDLITSMQKVHPLLVGALANRGVVPSKPATKPNITNMATGVADLGPEIEASSGFATNVVNRAYNVFNRLGAAFTNPSVQNAALNAFAAANNIRMARGSARIM